MWVHASRLWLALGTLGLVAAALISLGAYPLAGKIDRKVDLRIQQNVVWQPDSPEAVAERYRGSASPDATPVYVSFRFFNITNLVAVRLGSKPILEEVGPYTFQKVRLKRGVEWVRGGASVRWREYRYHLPVPELSNGSLDDPITTLNVPLLGALEHIESLGPWQARTFLELLAGLVAGWGDRRVRGLFTTRTVGELLFGYEDPLLATLAKMLPHIDPTFRLVRNMTSPEEADADYPTQANTGLEDLAAVWQYEEWENVKAVTSWNPPHVEPVHGSDASQFSPGLQLVDREAVWVGELFRAAQLVVTEQVKLGGVPLLRMRADVSQGDPDPRFFQYIRGLMNVTAPTAAGPAGVAGKPGPPLFLSYPHFCDADPRLVAGVEGLECRPKRHDLFLDVEPNTGITLRAAKRLMLSSWFGRKWHSIDPATQDTFLPIFWAEERSQAGGAQLRQFRPLLRARAAAAALRRYAQPAALAAAILAVVCLGAAVALWGDGSMAAEAGEGSGYSRLEEGERVPAGEEGRQQQQQQQRAEPQLQEDQQHREIPRAPLISYPVGPEES